MNEAELMSEIERLKKRLDSIEREMERCSNCQNVFATNNICSTCEAAVHFGGRVSRTQYIRI